MTCSNDRTPVPAIQVEDHPQITWLRYEGLNCPHFICCACGDPIKPEQQGIAEWRYDEDHTTVIEWRVRHKGHWCASAYALRQVPRAQWFWDNLELVLDQLLYNTTGRVPPERKHPDLPPAKPKRSKTRTHRPIATQTQRWRIMRRDNWTCQLCGQTAADGITLEVDHMQPATKGGTNADENLWTLCRECNQGKRDQLA